VQLVEPKPRLWRRDEYHRMAEAGIFNGQRVELIEGEIVEMSPQGGPHFTAVALAEETLRRIFRQGYVVRAQGLLSLGELSEPEPDVAVVSGAIRDYKEAHPTTALLVVEISDSTLTFDRGEKAGLYAKASILDYWIVNLIDRQVEVRRDPAPMAGQSYGHSYKNITIFTPAEAVSPLAAPQTTVRVADLLP